MPSISESRRELVSIGRRMYERGFVASNDGNISVRVDEQRLLITPSGVSKGFMNAADMVLLDLEGNILSRNGKPSSELPMHLAIYRERPCVQSVCHAHPPYATAFAAAGRELDGCLLSEMIFSLGKVPLIEYGTPGTADLYLPLLKILPDYDAFLLANHGVVTIGQSLEIAYHKLETVEHGAKITYLTEQLGGGKKLNTEQVRELEAVKLDQGITTKTDCLPCEADDSCATVANLKIDKIVNEVLLRLNKLKKQ